jgi:hypothetical protein
MPSKFDDYIREIEEKVKARDGEKFWQNSASACVEL